MRTRAGSDIGPSLGELDQRLAALDLLADADQHRLDPGRRRRADGVLHLHRLEYEHYLARTHLVARANADLEHLARHGRFDEPRSRIVRRGPADVAVPARQRAGGGGQRPGVHRRVRGRGRRDPAAGPRVAPSPRPGPAATGGSATSGSPGRSSGIPQPFGFQAEWNFGEGPGLNDDQTAVEVRPAPRRVRHGHVQARHRAARDLHPVRPVPVLPGRLPVDRRTPRTGTTTSGTSGVEWQIRKEMELVTEYSFVDGVNLNRQPGRGAAPTGTSTAGCSGPSSSSTTDGPDWGTSQRERPPVAVHREGQAVHSQAPDADHRHPRESWFERLGDDEDPCASFVIAMPPVGAAPHV